MFVYIFIYLYIYKYINMYVCVYLKGKTTKANEWLQGPMKGSQGKNLSSQ